MPKLKADPITQTDLIEFAANDSDFAFELRVLRQLRGLDFACQHSGTYEDPVTGKFRQFDIRARKNLGQVQLALAVECKNFRSNYPLLVSGVPRTETESFHDCIEYLPGTYGNSSRCKRLSGCDSVYPVGQSVGKKTDQVGRESSSELVHDDGAAFEKLNQAVHSCRDLVRDYGSSSQGPLLRVIMAVLVVPDSLLWQVDYSLDGATLEEPHIVPATTLFLGRNWEFNRGDGLQVPYGISSS